MKTLFQIQNRIENYKQTLLEIQNSSKPKDTLWHSKQISTIRERINELEWVKDDTNYITQKFVDEKKAKELALEFLEQNKFFQKDNNEEYIYLSENQKHSVDLAWLLKEFHAFCETKK
jgi:hypothetical protein